VLYHMNSVHVLTLSVSNLSEYSVIYFLVSKVFARSIPDSVIGLFNFPNPCRRTTALGSTQPITELNTKNSLDGKGRPTRKDNFTAICEPIRKRVRMPKIRITLLLWVWCPVVWHWFTDVSEKSSASAFKLKEWNE
jgi:hypothetical protein